MNCENIHKKHTGSHLQNILNQKSWSEVKVKWMLLSEHTSIKMIKTRNLWRLAMRYPKPKQSTHPLHIKHHSCCFVGWSSCCTGELKRKKKKCIPLKSSKTNAFRCNVLNTVPKNIITKDNISFCNLYLFCICVYSDKLYYNLQF